LEVWQLCWHLEVKFVLAALVLRWLKSLAAMLRTAVEIEASSPQSWWSLLWMALMPMMMMVLLTMLMMKAWK
jgi:hypothetical protein